MSETDDGGPGPQIKMPDVTPENGVTLRDWSAGQSIQSVVNVILAETAGKKRDENDIARAAYDLADAMLAARKREGS